MKDDVSKEIRELRESTGMNRHDFAIYMGIPYPTITDWELGHRRMPDYVRSLIAYRVRIDSLLKGSGSDSEFSATPYDDVFKTITFNCKELLYPLLNEVFGTKYTKKNIIEFHQNEHFISGGRGKEKKILSDESFDVLSSTKKFLKNYHLECQTNPDNTLALRFFQYDTQIALERSEIKDNKLELTLPDSAVIYLKCFESTSDKLTIKINTAGGSVAYDINALKIKNYSIDELFEKKLYVLLPFSMFLFEGELDECEKDKDKRFELEKKFEYIINRLNNLEETKKLTSSEHSFILEMMEKTSYNLNKKRPNIQKGVEKIMGGKILDYPAKAIRNAGRSETAVLMNYLVNTGRTDDIKRAAIDENFLNQLLDEYYKNNGS